MGFLGLNFGTSKSKSDSKNVLDKLESTLQNQTASTNSTQTNNTSGTQNTSSTGTNKQETASTQTGTRSSDGISTSSQFSQQSLQGLETLVGSLFSTAGGSSTKDAVGELSFDSKAYVDGIREQARARTATTLDAARGAIADMTGAKIGNNSAGVLLANRAESDAAANEAGIVSQAAATANQIETNSANSRAAGASADQSFLVNLLSQLKGGTSTTQQTGTEANTTQNAGSASATATESSASASTQTAVQTIQQLVEALLKGSTQTNATETGSVKSSGSQFGINASLGGK